MSSTFEELEGFWFALPAEAAIKISARTVVSWRLNWGWKTSCQSGSFTWLASWGWLLARSLSSLCESFPSLSEQPRRQPTSLQSKQSKKAKWKQQSLLWPSLGRYTASFLQYIINDTDQPAYYGRGFKEGVNTKNWGLHGANFAGYHKPGLLNKEWNQILIMLAF